MLWALAVVRYYCGSRFPPLSKADVPMIVVLALADPLGSAGCLVVAACLRAARRLAADGLLLTELALKCYLRNKLDPFSLTQIKREIQIHSKVAHRSIVPFYGSFEDERGNVYLLHQFTRRGDVFNALSSAGGVFSEEKTCAEIIQPVASAVAYLHTNGIMHRDIKPENLLVGEVGAGCQLTDFGFAVDYRRNRCVTRLGTTDYMAPEIVRCDKARRDKLRAMDRSGYGPEVDCWAIGILAFECLVGCAPFESNSTEETYRRILADEPEFPEHASPEARDFIRRCLE